jgi:GNAT superfamily N-acetyltransferase
MVLGTLSSPLLHLIGGDEVGKLKESPVLTRDIEEMRQSGSTGVFGGMSIPYLKWLIAPPRPSGAEQGDQGLPEGYSFDIVRGERGEYRRVMSRTEIPRTEESLGRMGCVGVRYGEELVAWVFLGVDGSVTALHVEPAHRGKGLAKAASRKLLRGLAEDPVSVGFRKLPEIAVEGAVGGSGGLGGQRGLEIGWEEGQERGKGEGWADSDVAVDNLESAGVARGLGGNKGWEVRWVSVDLRRVKEVVGL